MIIKWKKWTNFPKTDYLTALGVNIRTTIMNPSAAAAPLNLFNTTVIHNIANKTVINYN